MANNKQDWENLGRNIQNIVDNAVSSRDYEKLNQTIRQAVDRAVDAGTEAVRKVSERKQPAKKAKQGEVLSQKEVAALYGNTNGKTTKGILKIVGGGILSFFTLIFSAAAATMEFMFGIPGDGVGGWIATACFAGGGLLIGSGISNLKKIGRFKAYRKLLGQKTHCALDKLARSVGKTTKYVRKDLLKMFSEGLFLEGHLDYEQRHLITSNETYQHYEQSRLQLEQRQKEAQAQQDAAAAQNPQVQEVLNRGNAFISQIRRCNDAIPGEEISAKIYHMELIVQRIFQRAQSNPEIIPDLKKLMDYYLPMTVKLLNAYADMDALPVQGDTVTASKKEIEATLDTLNLAFEKLLDELFEDTALDISSDISVLNTLLAQEGLTEDALTRMKKQQTM